MLLFSFSRYYDLLIVLLLVCFYLLKNLVLPSSFFLARIRSRSELKIENLYFFNKFSFLLIFILFFFNFIYFVLFFFLNFFFGFWFVV